MKTKDTKQTLSANLSQNKHLLIIALIVFLLVYLASFVKGGGYSSTSSTALPALHTRTPSARQRRNYENVTNHNEA